MNSRDRIGGPLLVREKNLDAGEKGYDTLVPHISLMHDLVLDTTSHWEALFFVCLFAHSFVFLACSIARKPVLDG